MTKYRCVAYFRVSTQEQLKRDASLDKRGVLESSEDVDIEQQNRILHSFLKIHPEFEMARDEPFQEARSGSTMKKRQQLEMCLKYLEDGKADTLLVVFFDRLGRNFDDLMKTVGLLNKWQIHLFEIKDIYTPKKITYWDAPDKNSAINVVYNTMQMAFMSYNSSAYIERVSKASISHNNEMIKAGYYYFGGKTRYGYTFLKDSSKEVDILKAQKFGLERGDNKYHIVPEEAEVVRSIYKQYLEGDGAIAICDRLEREGKTLRGVPFKWSIIDDILKARAYAYGTYTVRKDTSVYARKIISNEIYNKETDLKRKLTRAEKVEIAKQYLTPDEVINQEIEGVFPPIIDIDTFERVQRIRLSKRPLLEKKITKDQEMENLLTGILFCGTCGNKMHSCGAKYHIHRGKKVYAGGYICSARKKQQVCNGPKHLSWRVDDVVWDTLKEDLLNGCLKDIYTEFWNQYVHSKSITEIEDNEEQVKIKTDKRKKLLKQITSINATIEDIKELDPDGVKALEEKKAKLLEKYNELNEEIKYLTMSIDDVESFKKEISEKYSYIDALEQNKRETILTYIDKVVFNHDKTTGDKWIDIYYKFEGTVINTKRVYLKTGNTKLWAR